MGTYNYPARELADEIGETLNNLEGDFTSVELAKALRLVAVEHRLQSDEAVCTAKYHLLLAEKGDTVCGVCFSQLRR